MRKDTRSRPKKKFASLIGAYFVLLLAGSAFAASQISVTGSGKITNLSTSEAQSFQLGELLDVTGSDPRLLEQEGRVPVLIFPRSSSGALKLNPPPIETLVSDRKQFSIDKDLGKVLDEYTQIQVLIRDQKYSEAESKLRNLKSVYPKVYFLNFIEASLKVLKRDNVGAINLLKEALKHHPDYQDGKILLEKLEAL